MSTKEQVEKARELGSQFTTRPLKEILDELPSIGDDEAAIKAFEEAVSKAVSKQELINLLKTIPPRGEG